jgi:hypothetical protein
VKGRIEALEARVGALERELAGVEARVAAGLALPARATGAPPAAVARPTMAAPDARESGAAGTRVPEAPQWSSLLGRTMLVFAGAYLVRALTEAGTLSLGAGVLAGLAYALGWLVAAERAAAAGAAASASFHASAGALIAHPLVYEAAVRWGALDPRAAAAALVIVHAAGSALAARRHLPFAAWAFQALGLGTAGMLFLATYHAPAVVTAWLGMALVSEVLARRPADQALRWPAAAAADLGVLLLVWLASRPAGLPDGYAAFEPRFALWAALALPALYLVSVALRTLHAGRAVCGLEAAQSAVAVALGFGGAARVVSAQGGAPTGLGLAAFVLGVGCSWLAFTFVERRKGQGTNFYFYSTAGLVLLLFGSQALLAGGLRVIAWSAAAALAAGLARRYARVTLRSHSVVYLTAAALAAVGLETGGVAAPAWGAVAAAAVLAVAWLRVDGEASPWQRAPAAWAAATAAWVGFHVLSQLAARAAGEAALPTLRTALLAVAALVSAELSARRGRAEVGWLVVPLLVVGGLKLLVEDLPAGRPAALVSSFAIYGAALSLAPRRLRASG